MNLQKLLFTQNDCYKSGKKHTVKGIMVHSTGANNPKLSRYVGPDDGKLGPNQYNNHWNTAKPGGISVCVHGFIGLLADKTIATYQTLPWDMVGWHSGSGSKGSAANCNNNGYIGFEICEDGLMDSVYFNKVYVEAVELCAYLCKQYNLDPLKDGVLICHSEGHKRGIASNHADVMHWFPKHGKNMDTFRAAVKEAMGGAVVQKPTIKYRVRMEPTNADTQIGAYNDLNNAKAIAKANPGYEVYDFDGKLVYDPATDAEAVKTYEAEKQTVENAVADGIITSPDHWVGVLTGEIPANPAFVKILIDKYHDALTAAKRQA